MTIYNNERNLCIAREGERDTRDARRRQTGLQQKAREELDVPRRCCAVTDGPKLARFCAPALHGGCYMLLTLYLLPLEFSTFRVGFGHTFQISLSTIYLQLRSTELYSICFSSFSHTHMSSIFTFDNVNPKTVCLFFLSQS